MGITDLQFIGAENTNQGEDAARQSREKAESAVKELAASW
jgi:FMN-dependent NADH-azoreductase